MRAGAGHRTSHRSAGNTRPLASIAIVDGAPEEQYVYPEFLLFQQLFERHGLRAVIADPTALERRDGLLCHGDLAIDLVYNRLTDFHLEQASSAALREAYLLQGVVLTPHPQAHALYADKRHLALFSDAARLQALGVPPTTQQILLEHVPRTEGVMPPTPAVGGMSAALARRAPDHAGTFADGPLTFGHRRLAIIDLSASADQPMVDTTVQLALVFNGTIYNYRDLRIELIALGYAFFSEGDSEVILKAYHAWSEQCV